MNQFKTAQRNHEFADTNSPYPLSLSSRFSLLHQPTQKDPRYLRGRSSGKLIYRGVFDKNSSCPQALTGKLQKLSAMPPVGNDALLRAALGSKGGLSGTLARTSGIVGMASFINDNGGEITIDEGQIGSDAKVVEHMTGACNNQDKNFHETGSAVKTTKVHRAVVRAVELAPAGPFVKRNRNNGSCEQTCDANAKTNCRPNDMYPEDQLEAGQQITRTVYEKIPDHFSEARHVVDHHFGDFSRKKHEQDGKPVISQEEVGGVVVHKATSRHLCQMPNSALAVQSTITVRLELGVAAGLWPSYDDGDVATAILDFLEIFVSGSAEPAAYRGTLNPEKTNNLLAMVRMLRGGSLKEVVVGAGRIGKLCGGRGLTAEDGERVIDLLFSGVFGR